MTIDPKEWKPVLREAFHPPNAQDELALSELGVPFHEQRSFEKTVPDWRWPLWGVAIEETMKKGGDWERGRTIGLYGDRPPSFSPVQVALGKTRMVPESLAAVLAYKDAKGMPQKFVLSVERQFKSVKVGLVGKEGQ